ncbi:hypothetical protein HYV86_01045 [Candidatus Woesearchaeota archaeon]|nr:hypothetical protein [Candidatus Woesearchaeota archaeon]
MEVLKTRTCERCKAQVPLNRVKLFPRSADHNWLVCENCCDVLRNMNMSQGGRGMSSAVPEKKEPVRNVYAQRAQVEPFRPSDLANKDKPRLPPGIPQRMVELAKEPHVPVRNVYSTRTLPVPLKSMSSAADLVSTATHKNLFCARCNFNFKVDKEKVGVLHRLSCPYCGKSDKLEVAKPAK